MKIIEAMKRGKLNSEKIADLQSKIQTNTAFLSLESPPYGVEQRATVDGWLQSCLDLTQEMARLQVAIQRTNLATQVTIELGGVQVTKCIAEWVLRRRTYAAIDLATMSRLTDRNLKEGHTNTPAGGTIELKIVRFYDPTKRDEAMALYRAEPHLIDAALEIINATTDLLEA